MVNIAPSMLSMGCIGQMIEDRLPERRKGKFSARHTYDYVVVIGDHADDWNDPPAEYVLLLLLLPLLLLAPLLAYG
jgi:hypothetical protein